MNLKSSKIVSTIQDQVYDVLKENIISGRLKPGERIQEVQIATELKVSRSPVRNAINQLVGEGLLESFPNKYVCVKHFTDLDIIDSYEFRLIIEKFAIEKICTLTNTSIKKNLKKFKKDFLANAQFEQMSTYLKIDIQFHDYIISISKNHIIYEALAKVSMMISPFRVLALSSEKRFYESVDEHINIINAILDEDTQAAVKACETHLTLAKEEILKHLSEH